MRTVSSPRDIETAADPLAEVVDYPWDAPVSLASIPFGVDAENRPVTLGLLGSSQLLAGMVGSGKSVGLATLLCGISRLENVALVGFDHSAFGLAPWTARFSRIAGEHESTSVLAALVTEMDRRFAWLAAHDLKTMPGQLSPAMPSIVIVIDELAMLVDYGFTPDEKAADIARAAMIRRLMAKGRAAGIVMIAATQKPYDPVLPGDLRDLFGGRVAYATTTLGMTDSILGAGMSMRGGLSHEIPAELKGVCYIVSEASRVPVRARTYLVEPDQPAEGMKSPLRIVAERAANLRLELPWMPAKSEAPAVEADVEADPFATFSR